MNADEREIVRQILTVIDAMSIRANKRISEALHLIQEPEIPLLNHRMAKIKLEEAQTILEDMPHRKKAIYKMLEEQAKNDSNRSD